MASSSTTQIPSSQTQHFQSLSQPVNNKLEGPNYLTWSVQFQVFLRSHDLSGMIDGSEEAPSKLLADNSPNPAYIVWFRKDNCVLSWLLASISEKLVSTVFSLKTSKQVWDSLQTRFSATSRSRIALLKRQLQTIVQGNRSCSSFFEDAKQLADNLAAAGQPVNDQDFITFLLGGLRATYTPFITSYNFACREKELSLDEFQSELLSFETLVEAPILMQNQNFAFAAKHNAYPKRKPTGPVPRSNQFVVSAQPRGPSKNQFNTDRANLQALHPYDDHDTVEVGNGSDCSTIPVVSDFSTSTLDPITLPSPDTSNSSPLPTPSSNHPPHASQIIESPIIPVSSNLPLPLENPCSQIVPHLKSSPDPKQVKDLGELSYFLGIQAIRNSDGLHLQQAKYITDLLHSTDMIGAKPLNCPFSSESTLAADQELADQKKIARSLSADKEILQEI
ncbi:hypothetical protein DKX38_006880 [Salix brachista]|uniref:Retrotransposon Copia-like N-terminal domain-containing protein n=1 Tax=Salix brachista TaxID=2182728 RepID=A0A5N5MP76_9ROSI|nr:hypothetical protein DKX38_006880 [Salix brachista]